MINLRDYQRDAVEGTLPLGLAPAIVALLTKGGPDRLIAFEAPTGSGKTVMLAAALDRAGHGAATLWLTPGKGGLAEQSAAALERFLDSSTLTVERLDETWLSANAAIAPGAVLVANWEALTQVDATTQKRKNRVTREGETRSLFDALDATAAAGTPLIVVIDESHWGASAIGTTTLLADIETIAPALRVEASATPVTTTTSAGRSRGRHVEVTVDLDDVIAAGMLAARVCVNTGLQDHLDALPAAERAGAVGETSTLEAAWQRHGLLTAAYQAAGSPVRPLLLVQIPDSKAGSAKLDSVEAFFRAKGVDRSNGRLAVYLSDDKTDNLEAIEDFTSPVDVMVFKTGVATGWDCPRAQILVAFREMRSEIFAIQTVGRILRTPERKHYGSPDPDPVLDVAYIYANIDAPTGPHSRDAKRPEVANVSLTRGVGELRLPASYASRAGGYDDIKPRLFTKCFSAAATTVNLHEQLPTSPPAFTESLATDRTVTTADVLDGDDQITSIGSDVVAVALTDHDLQAAFDVFLGRHTGGYRGRARSLPVMANVLYSWFEKSMSGDWADLDDDELVLAVQRTAQTHGDVLGEALDLAAEAHRAKETVQSRSTVEFDWELREQLQVSSETHSSPADPSGYAYADAAGVAWRVEPSGPETALEAFLATECAAGRALWWWKNGVGDRSSYSLSYTNANGDPDTTYPDYIVELPQRDGQRRIAILEAKDLGDKDVETPRKAAAIAAAAVGLRQAGFEIVAGVVADLPGGLALNDGSNYTAPARSSLTDSGSGWVPLRAALA